LAQRDGWASGSGDVESVRAEAAVLGWAEVATRLGDPPVSVLTPTEASAPRSRSLSAQYGLGQQPLHTDGAHLANPPDVMVLVSSHPSPTATLVWVAPVQISVGPGSVELRVDAFMHGMFVVHSGRDSFYAPAWSGGRVRFDPGCMTACDARTREVQEYLAAQLPVAAVVPWARAGQVLVIDNRQALHARAAVAAGDEDRELTRVGFRIGAAQ
jgi:hypothetical protein